ncbi:MAG: hypothetical protein Q9187_004830 [Circinaria calcarea]
MIPSSLGLLDKVANDRESHTKTRYIIMPVPKKAFVEFLGKAKWDKVIPKAGGGKKKGDRLFPSRTPKNDENANLRADKGSEIADTGEVEIVIQANLNAKDPAVRKAAEKDSHDVVAKATVDPKNPDPEKLKKDLEEDFTKRNA